jgi:mannosyltransferase
VDEAYTLITSHQSLAGTWHRALHFELQPPLYFLLLNGWLRLGDGSIEWARAFSTLCIVGCFVVLWLATRPARAGRGVAAPILATVTATCVWAAAEARDYALLLLLSAVSYWLLLRIVTGQSRRVTRDAFWYGLVAYLSLLTMYYSGFVLLGQWVAALTSRRARRPITVALAVVGVALIPWIGVILEQVSGHVNPNLEFAADVAQSRLPGGAVSVMLRDLLGAVFAAAPALNRPYVIFGVLALLAAVPLLRLSGGDARHGGGQQMADERVLAIALAVTTLSFVVLRVTNFTFIAPRHMAVLTPGFLLLWSTWIARTGSTRRAWISSVCVLAAGLLTLASYERDADVADSRGAAAYVARQSLTDPVLVVGPENVFPFRYYYRGRNHGSGPVVGVPIDASVEQYDPDAVLLTRPSQIADRMSAAGVQRDFLVVVSKQYIWKSDTAAAALQAFLRAHGARDSVDFKNLYVARAVR